MKIGVLTSSRADYGIYKPLLAKLAKDERFELIIIVFGMHLQLHHGNTIEAIEKDDFGIIDRVLGMPNKDTSLDIVKGYGQLIIEFSEYWNTSNFDYVFALGDRFEMSAAVQAGIPFGIKFAHIHGGETNLGAIDNIYRHQISLGSNLHFVASEIFIKRVENIIDSSKNIFNVGSLSLDGIKELKLPNWNDVRREFNIPDKPFILVTFHPETVGIEKNENFCKIIYETLEVVCRDLHVIITLANADTMGSLYRDISRVLKRDNPKNISLIDNFGKENYFAAMNASEMLLGNTSSGILEAASFGKYVINVGERQSGRLGSKNVINVPFNKDEIIKSIKKVVVDNNYQAENIYYKPNVANEIIKILANDRL